MIWSCVAAVAIAASSGGEVEQAWTPPPLIEAPAPARSAEALSAPPMVQAPASAPPRLRELWSLVMEAGVPDGAAVGIRWRPLRFACLSGSVLTNGSAPGGRAGLALCAPDWPLKPSIGVDAGHVFEGNAGWALAIAGSKFGTMLSKVSYDFYGASAGAELGSSRVAFTLRAGAGLVNVTVPNVADALTGANSIEFSGQPVQLTLFHPSVRLGLRVGFD